MSRVAVLKGGRSLERQVSLRSGARVQDALERLGHEAVAIDVGADFVGRLRDADPEVAFVALHGREGEDGTVQELLDVLGVPYTGSDAPACMTCANKDVAKTILRDVGIPTPDFVAFGEAAFRELGAADALPAIGDRLEFPLVVKPASQGSALGVRFARRPEDVPAALMSALSYDRRVLIERHVAGRDLAVGVLDGPDGPEALPVVEAIPQGDAYDFEARYEIGKTRFDCPAALSPDTAAEAAALALAVYERFGCTGFARVDLMLSHATGELTVLEADAVPGLTETSLVPQAAEAGGVAFEDLVGRLLDRALERAAV